MDRSQLFINDLKRLHRQAIEGLRGVVKAPIGAARAEPVRRFFDAIHTFKGTAGMVKGYEEVSRLLHDLEGKLASRPVDELAADAAWLTDANRALLGVHAIILKRILPAEASAAAQAAPPEEERGILAVRANGTTLWIPIGAVLGFLPREKFAEKKSVLASGHWIPVLAGPRDEIAVISKVAAGIVAVGVREVVGLRTRAEALETEAAA